MFKIIIFFILTLLICQLKGATITKIDRLNWVPDQEYCSTTTGPGVLITTLQVSQMATISCKIVGFRKSTGSLIAGIQTSMGPTVWDTKLYINPDQINRDMVLPTVTLTTFGNSTLYLVVGVVWIPLENRYEVTPDSCIDQGTSVDCEIWWHSIIL